MITRQFAFSLVSTERDRQVRKHGLQDYNTDEEWLAILVEEVGEAAQAVVEKRFRGGGENLVKEIVQVAAVAVSWLEKRGQNQERKP